MLFKNEFSKGELVFFFFFNYYIRSPQGFGLAGYGSFALPNMLRFDSRYQQDSVGGHHIPKRVCSVGGLI